MTIKIGTRCKIISKEGFKDEEITKFEDPNS